VFYATYKKNLLWEKYLILSMKFFKYVKKILIFFFTSLSLIVAKVKMLKIYMLLILCRQYFCKNMSFPLFISSFVWEMQCFIWPCSSGIR
jgi:hypothetical protein